MRKYNLIIVLLLFACICKAEDAYLVSISKKNIFYCDYVKTKKQVSEKVFVYTQQEFNFNEILVNSIYFDLKTEKYYVYVEKKRVVRKKNGKIKYKRIKK